MSGRILLVLALLLPAVSAQEKVLRFPIRADGPKSLDPVRGSSQYESIVCDQVYDTLLQYKYLVRPMQLEPQLLAKMPEISEGGTVYHFALKKGVKFRDDPCFPGGKGRELVARDVFYSWKRMADTDNNPRSWWLFKNAIKGFDAYREAQNEAKTFDYDAPVEGMQILGDYEFKVILNTPVTRFLYVLAMFQTAIVPREAVEKYGRAFANHPVGTGPFLLPGEEAWKRTMGITLVRNPNYRDERYPSEWSPELAEYGGAAGQKLPFLDRIEITFFQQDQPMWLEWLSGNLDYVQVPAENFTAAFTKRKKRLKKKWRGAGVRAYPVKLLDFIFRGFNMDDPVVGGYTEEKKNLRRAMHLALDLNEFNDTFYNGINVVYDGPIPPNMEGHPETENHLLENSWQGPDLERARALLARAGYPEGKGLPEIEFWTSTSGNSAEQAELMRRQMARIGVILKVRLVDFSQMSQAVHEKRAQMFSFAWGSDYPDAENNLALFYGPNESPGANWSNYKNPEYDAMYRNALAMPISPERTALYRKMRDMVIRDVPYMGSMARTRFYLTRPWLKNCHPTETFWTWYKYLDLDVAAQKKK